MGSDFSERGLAPRSRCPLVNAYDDLVAGYGLNPADWPMARPICRQWLEQRLLALATAQASEAVSKGNLTDARSILARAELPSGTVSRTVLSPNSVDFLQTMRTPLPGAIPTGFDPIDNAWGGGVRPGELGIVAGATGIGKSMILCYLAASAYWSGASCLYYTFELTREQIRDRIALGILQRGKRDVRLSWQEELEAAAKRRRLNAPPDFAIDIRDGENAGTWPEIIADLEAFKDEHSAYPDVLLLDSADDVAPLQKTERLYESLRNTFVFLRAQAQLKKLRVWTSAQLNRDAVERAVKTGRNQGAGKVDLRQIGDSFAKAQKSHYVLGFAQTEQDKTDVDGPKMQVYVLKDSLHGTTGGWPQKFAFCPIPALFRIYIPIRGGLRP